MRVFFWRDERVVPICHQGGLEPFGGFLPQSLFCSVMIQCPYAFFANSLLSLPFLPRKKVFLVVPLLRYTYLHQFQSKRELFQCGQERGEEKSNLTHEGIQPPRPNKGCGGCFAICLQIHASVCCHLCW